MGARCCNMNDEDECKYFSFILKMTHFNLQLVRLEKTERKEDNQLLVWKTVH